MDYRIDYDRVDVADIMDQVKKRVADNQPAPEAPPAGPPVPPPARGWKGLLKKTARFLARPYFPFLIPLYEWFKFSLNYEVNVRIDETATRLQSTRDEIMTRLQLTQGEIVTRFEITRDEIVTKLGTTQATAKLLHNLVHNLVLELTKLKVEEEALKSKVRVLEKELETLGKREKAIEKRAFK